MTVASTLRRGGRQCVRFFTAALIAAAAFSSQIQPAQAETTVRTIAATSVSVPNPVPANLVQVQGESRATDLRYYDLTITVAGQKLPTLAFYTAVASHKPSVNVNLLGAGAALAEVQLAIRHAYDSAKATCVVGVDARCAALPFDPARDLAKVNEWDFDWDDPTELPDVRTAPVSSSGLIIEATALVGGSPVAGPATVTVPFVGQLIAVVP